MKEHKHSPRGGSAKNNPLVGKWFHSLKKDTDYPEFPDGIVQWQGQVLGSPEPDWYLVQLYSWLDGGPTDQHLVPFQELIGWLFYDDDEQMRFANEHGSARPGGPYNPSDRRLREVRAMKEARQEAVEKP